MLKSLNNAWVKSVAIVIAAGVVGAVAIEVSVDSQHVSNAASSFPENEFVIAKEHIEMAPGKAGSILQFVLPSRYKANSGDAVDIRVVVLSSQDVQHIELTAQPESGMALISSSLISRNQLVAGERMEAQFRVVALAEGQHYLNITVSANLDSSKRMSSYSVPVKIGDRQVLSQKSRPHIIEDDQGMKLIVMPAKNPDQISEPK